MQFNSYVASGIKTASSVSMTSSSLINKKENCFGLKKLAFTLAEVLITLTIIGVVAAMTIPTLMVKYRERVVITKLKKAQSVLANAAQMAVTKDGNFGCSSSVTDDLCVDGIKRIFSEMKVAKDCASLGKWHGQDGCNDVPDNSGDAEYTIRKYIISEDGLVFGIHSTGNSVTVTIPEYKVPSTGAPIVFGFDVADDGTVEPGKQSQETAKMSNITCPTQYNAGHCTYWTIMTGKLQKKQGEAL